MSVLILMWSYNFPHLPWCPITATVEILHQKLNRAQVGTCTHPSIEVQPCVLAHESILYSYCFVGATVVSICLGKGSSGMFGYLYLSKISCGISGTHTCPDVDYRGHWTCVDIDIIRTKGPKWSSEDCVPVSESQKRTKGLV